MRWDDVPVFMLLAEVLLEARYSRNGTDDDKVVSVKEHRAHEEEDIACDFGVELDGLEEVHLLRNSCGIVVVVSRDGGGVCFEGGGVLEGCGADVLQQHGLVLGDAHDGQVVFCVAAH